MSESNQLPPAAVIVTHQVADWATWKTLFDGHEDARKAAGILGHHINPVSYTHLTLPTKA